MIEAPKIHFDRNSCMSTFYSKSASFGCVGNSSIQERPSCTRTSSGRAAATTTTPATPVRRAERSSAATPVPPPFIYRSALIGRKLTIFGKHCFFLWKQIGHSFRRISAKTRKSRVILELVLNQQNYGYICIL